MTDDPKPLNLNEQLARMREKLTLNDTPRPGHATAAMPMLPTAEALRQQHQERWPLYVTPRYDGASLDDPGLPVEGLRRWLAVADQGTNLVLGGPTGTGKTHAALAAAREYFLRGNSFRLWAVVDLVNALDYRMTAYQDVLTEARQVDLLMLDDIGMVGTGNDFVIRQLYTILNGRWSTKRPTIATTNLTRSQLAEAVGEPITSRLLGGAVTLRVKGEDRRHENP